MRIKLSNSISIIELLLTLLGLINSFGGIVLFKKMYWLFPLFIMVSGFIIIGYIIYIIIRKHEISTFITNNEKRCMRELATPLNH